jgi:hypothetical protein
VDSYHKPMHILKELYIYIYIYIIKNKKYKQRRKKHTRAH